MKGTRNTGQAPLDQLEKALHAFEASAANFANIMIHEARVRQNYMSEIRNCLKKFDLQLNHGKFPIWMPLNMPESLMKD